jgi:hypothetical protein
MVAQNSPCQFLAKMCKFSDDNKARERHRSHVAHATLTHAHMVAHSVAHAGSTQRNPSRLHFVTGHIGCPEKVARPGTSCEFLPNSP